MKSGFKDPIAIRKEDPKNKPIDGKKSVWDFRCPAYDERSSCFVNAGTHYGEGHRQPVGHEGNPKMEGSILPTNGHRGVNVEEVG